MEIRELLDQTDKLPNVPDVVRELIQQLNNPNADYGEIATKVSKDQTMSLKILRLVNSAHFGLSRKVSSIDEAVVMLGMARLKTMVIASGIAGSVKEVEGLDLKKFWSEAFLVATAARWAANFSNKADPDIAFTVGLIHNIGRLLLHLAKPKLALAIQTRIEQDKTSRSAAEMERLGFITPQAGQALLDFWKFPAEMGEAVLQHKAPANFEEPSAIAACINIGCIINAAQRNELTVEDITPKFSEELLNIAGISNEMLDSLEDALALESGMESLAEAA